MIAIDYNKILDSKIDESWQGYKRMFSFNFLTKYFYSTGWFIRKLNKRLTQQLLATKSIHAYLIENIDEFKGKKLTNEIASVENAIRKMFDIESDIEQCLSNPKFKKLTPTHDLTNEILDEMYNVLGVLKKVSLKTPIKDRTEEARIAVSLSQQTMKKIIHGR